MKHFARRRIHYFLLEVKEVVGLVNQKELESTSTQVVTPEVDFSQLRNRALEILVQR